MSVNCGAELKTGRRSWSLQGPRSRHCRDERALLVVHNLPADYRHESAEQKWPPCPSLPMPPGLRRGAIKKGSLNLGPWQFSLICSNPLPPRASLQARSILTDQPRHELVSNQRRHHRQDDRNRKGRQLPKLTGPKRKPIVQHMLAGNTVSHRCNRQGRDVPWACAGRRPSVPSNQKANHQQSRDHHHGRERDDDPSPPFVHIVHFLPRKACSCCHRATDRLRMHVSGSLFPMRDMAFQLPGRGPLFFKR